jgi:rubredoxin
VSKREWLACRYLYDSAVGEPANGTPDGTATEDPSDDWVCPACGAGMDTFERVD